MPIDLGMLSDPERAQLAGTLGVGPDELEVHLETHAAAAVEEYVRMFLGQRVYTRGSDIREYRLLLLIKHALGGRIPSEAAVSRLFQTTESQSRSLIRSVMSKFQYELREEILQTLNGTLTSAQRDKGLPRGGVTSNVWCRQAPREDVHHAQAVSQGVP